MARSRSPAARLSLAARHPLRAVFALALALGGTAALAAAADAPPPPAQSPANAADGPGRADGRHHRHHRWPREVDLAKAEQRAKAAFDRVDSNDDERISPAEVAAAGPRAFGPMGMGGHHGRHHGRPLGPDRMAPSGMGPGGMGPGGMGASDPQAGEGADRPGREQVLGAVFQRLDANRDGKLSTDEFSHLRDAQRDEMQARRFARMDTDGNGSLSRTEFPPLLAHLRTLDANRDGKVTRDEFPRHHRRHDGRPADAAPRG